MKTILSLLILLFSLQLWANSVIPYSYTVEGKDGTFIDVRQTTTGASFNTLVTEYSSSTSQVYLPINSATDSSKTDYSTIDTPSELPTNTADSYLYISLKVTTSDSATYYLNAAYEDPDSEGSYLVTPFVKSRIAAETATTDDNYHKFTSAVTEQTISAYINIKNICESDCELSNSELSRKIYFFLTSTNITEGTSISPSNYPAGSTIEFNLSDKVPGYSTTLNDLRKGDGRLIADITSANISDGYKTVTFFQLGTVADPGATTIPAVLSAGFKRGDDIDFTYNGDTTISGLTNGQAYTYIVALITKYQFSTKPSNAKTGTPESIETFLQQQQCYLLSAGFQEEHYVIEYFKMIRDKYLLKSWAGTQFVHFYYWSAPHFTRYIYQSKVLSAFFRGVGYTMYFLFHHAVLLILGSIALFLIVVKKRVTTI